VTDVVIVVPILARAHRVAPLVDSIRATCDARIVFAVTTTDRLVHQAVDAAGCKRIAVAPTQRGDYARKVNAVYRATTEPLIFLGADDLRFHPGWLEAARSQLLPGIGVVGTNDLGSPRVMAGEHATHSLVTRAYADEHGTLDGPGAILCERYVHEYVDDELVGTAKLRGAWAFAVDSHVEHLHPNWGKGKMDKLYAQQGRRMRADRALHQQRARLWT
jgi:hypothetical protein